MLFEIITALEFTTGVKIFMKSHSKLFSPMQWSFTIIEWACCISSWRKRDIEMWVLWYRFSQKNDLNQHVAAVHEGNNPFKCEVCEYSSSQKGDLKKHVASVHEVCDYSFCQKSDLNKLVPFFYQMPCLSTH